MTGRIPTSDIRKRMSETLNMLSEPDRWVVITRHGEPVAAMVPVNLLWKMLEAGNGGPRRLSYPLPGQSCDMIETGSASVLERKAMIEPLATPDPIEVEVGQDSLPNLDDLLRRIDRLRIDLPHLA